MSLPTAKTPKHQGIKTFLLYGRPKIGKSTFCAEIEGAYFIATEPRLNHLDVFRDLVGSWEELLMKLKELATEEHAFKAVIIDTIDNAYKFCLQYICKREKINHPSDREKDFGKTWGMVTDELARVLTKLACMPYTLVLVSHAIEVEVETRTGTIKKIVPDLPKSARTAVLGLVDAILYIDIEKDSDGKERRVLRTQPTSHYEAGDATGKLPETLPLDYAAFKQASETQP